MEEGMMKKLKNWLSLVLIWAAFILPAGVGGTANAAEKTVSAKLTMAPQVPPPVNRAKQALVKVHLEAKEYVGMLVDGVKYKFWSFNGTVPGPMVRVRVGDTVEIHLKNHSKNTFPHNIDLHAVNGPGGGGAVSLVKPGKEAVFSFKALNPGLYIYHCASPIPNMLTHIANGMYGLILVEPEGGLPKVDREYYVMQSEFFTEPSEEKDILQLSMQKALAEHPDHVVFNGQAGALMEEGALKAKTGEMVRVFFGNISPNSISSFHIIGEIFDKVYSEGALDGKLNHNVQTTLVPSAGSTIVEFKVDVPGAYLLVDTRASRMAKGAVGALVVTGPEDASVFKSIKKP
jgi:nitrite reductase (NO-forming)